VKRCPSEELVFMLATGELTADEATRLAEHVRGCDTCSTLLRGYEETLSALRAGEPGREEIGTPSAPEWDRLMAGVRQRVRPGASSRPGVPARASVPGRPNVLAWPTWAKAAAGGGAVIAAAALVAVVLWQAGLFTDSRPGGAPGVAAVNQAGRSTPEASAPSGEDASGNGQPAGDLLTDDGSVLSLASLGSDLPELDELTEGVGGTQDSDFMLFYLTEEEETRLVEELEGSTNIQKLE